MRMTAVGVTLVLLSTAFTGCLGTEDVAGADDDAPPTPATPRAAVVVADVSAGVNPYHEAFRRPGWTHAPGDAIPGFPQDARRLDLTLGDDYEASRAADADLWDAYENGVLHWVPGTNLILLTLRPFDWLPDGSRNTFHGTQTAHVVSNTCADCYVLVIQDRYSIDGEPYHHVAEDLPWVDFTTSTNTPGNWTEETFDQNYAKGTRALHESGRLHVAPSGNNVVPGLRCCVEGVLWPTTQVNYPPWVVMAGGAHSECSATAGLAAKPPEFVGNFTQVLAAPESVDEYWRVSGTSYATPQVAGFLGRALYEVRSALGPGTREPGTLWTGEPGAGPFLEDGRLLADEVREAFAATARYFTTTDYAPTTCPDSTWATPVPPSPTPWVEMGWGYVGEDEAVHAARVLLGEDEAPRKPEAAEAWMAQHAAARRALYP